jgi:hypothetical protein
MEQSLTCESDTRAINQEVSSPFKEREGSLPHSESLPRTLLTGKALQRYLRPY